MLLDFINASAIGLIGLMGLVIGGGILLWCSECIAGMFNKKAIRVETEESWRERFGDKDWEGLVKKYDCKVPDSLAALYASDLVDLNDVTLAPSLDAPEEKQWYVAFFMPVYAQSLEHTWDGCEKFFAFADDGCGNGYLIDPRIADPPVFFHDHECGTFNYVCDTLSEFITWPQISGGEND
jgi:hypothetical protein